MIRVYRDINPCINHIYRDETHCKSKLDPGIYKHNPRSQSAYSLSEIHRKMAHVYSNLTSAHMWCAHSLHSHVRVSLRGGARSRACMRASIQLHVSLYTYKETYKPGVSEIPNHKSLGTCRNLKKVMSHSASRCRMRLFRGDMGLFGTASPQQFSDRTSNCQIGHFLNIQVDIQ